MDKDKEKLKIEFGDFHWGVQNSPMKVDAVFEWFWRHLEEQTGLLEIELNNKKILLEACESALAGRDKSISEKDELIKVADEALKYFDGYKMSPDGFDAFFGVGTISRNQINFYKALEHYQSLKSKT